MNFGTKSNSISMQECNPTELERIKAYLTAEHPHITSIRTEVVHFKKSDLSLDDPDTHAKGKLYNFVVERLGPVEFSLDALYRTIVDECTRKSRSTVLGSDLPEVLDLRGVTRSNTEDWLNHIRQRVAAPRWEDISHKLSWPFFHLNSMGRVWGRYCIEVLDTNAALSAVRGEIAKILKSGVYDQIGEIQELVELLIPLVQPIALDRLSPISIEKIKVMIIYEAYART